MEVLYYIRQYLGGIFPEIKALYIGIGTSNQSVPEMAVDIKAQLKNWGTKHSTDMFVGITFFESYMIPTVGQVDCRNLPGKQRQ